MAKAKAKKASNSVYTHPKGQTFLSFQEVSRRAQVRPQTVKSWVAKGQIRTYLILGREMIADADLTAFLEPKAVERPVMPQPVVAPAAPPQPRGPKKTVKKAPKKAADVFSV